jgi:hypothetical protein
LFFISFADFFLICFLERAKIAEAETFMACSRQPRRLPSGKLNVVHEKEVSQISMIKIRK